MNHASGTLIIAGSILIFSTALCIQQTPTESNSSTQVSAWCASRQGEFVMLGTTKVLANKSPQGAEQDLAPTATLDPVQTYTYPLNQLQLFSAQLDAFQSITPKECLLAPGDALAHKVHAPNPLYNAHIEHMALSEGDNGAIPYNKMRAVIVTKEAPAFLQLIESCTPTQCSIVICGPLADSTGEKVIGKVCALEASLGEFFAAVAPQKNRFGAPGSGIAYARLGTVQLPREALDKIVESIPDETTRTEVLEQNKDEENIIYPLFSLANAATGEGGFGGSGRACPLDESSTVLCIRSPEPQEEAPFVHLNDNVSLHWSASLGRLFVGLSVRAQAHGAHALLVGRFAANGKQLIFTPLVDEAEAPLLAGITTAMHEGDAVVIKHINTMHTSTGIHYVIVQGGADFPDRMVYAVPLIGHCSDGSTQEIVGKMASMTAEPHNEYDQKTNRLGYRSLRKAAASGETTLPTNRLLVGGGKMKAGDITSLKVVADAVFVTVAKSEHNAPGLFSSQAIFDTNGTIKGWSEWQRVAGVTIPADDSAHLYGEASTLCLGSLAQTSVGILHTHWQDGQSSVAPAWIANVQAHLAEQIDEKITNLWTGIVEQPRARTSLCALTTQNSIFLAQTATDIGNGFVPEQQNVQSWRVPLGKGSENPLGVLRAAAITADKQGTTHLFIAGQNGVGCLVGRADFQPLASLMLGSGLQPVEGVQETVKKILVDGPHVYFVCPRTLYRLSVDNPDKAICIAHFEATIFDAIFSGPLAVLGTSEGLYVVSPDCDVRKDTPRFTRVELPATYAPAVAQLYPVTQSGDGAALTHGSGGTIYALLRSHATNMSQVCRFSVAGIPHGAAVPAEPVHLINDRLLPTSNAPYIKFVSVRHHLATDGAVILSGRNPLGEKSFPECSLIAPHIPMRVGQCFLGMHLHQLSLPLQGVESIIAIKKDLGMGYWYIVCDNKLIVNA